jgi:S1-C subfamily serine protease
MSVDTPPEPEQTSKDEPLVLRREALLPNERSRGLGTVAVVCTMAGVASGLALATTLMAMQVADSMTVRTCPYRVVATDVQAVDYSSDHGFLGIRYVFRDGVAEIDSVLPGTPAATLGLRRGDHVISIDGAPIRAADDLKERIYGSHPGAQPTLTIERDGNYDTVRPTLAAWPSSANVDF